jgi:hypothetical protein
MPAARGLFRVLETWVLRTLGLNRFAVGTVKRGQKIQERPFVRQRARVIFLATARAIGFSSLSALLLVGSANTGFGKC